MADSLGGGAGIGGGDCVIGDGGGRVVEIEKKLLGLFGGRVCDSYFVGKFFFFTKVYGSIVSGIYFNGSDNETHRAGFTGSDNWHTIIVLGGELCDVCPGLLGGIRRKRMRRKITGALVKNPLLSGSVLMMGGSLGASGINYFYHLAMGRVLGPVDYGTLASIFAVIYILSIVPISSSFAVVKFISSAKTKEEVAGIFKEIKGLVFKISAGLAVGFLVISPGVSKFLHIDNVMLVAMIAPYVFFSLMSLVYQATLQGLLKFWGVVGPSLVSSVFKLVLGLGLVLLGWSVMGAMVGLVMAVMISFGYVRSLAKHIPSSETSKPFLIGGFLRYSVPVLVQALAFTSLFTMDVILVKHYLSPFDAGLYAALSTLGKIIYFASQPLVGVMFPIVSGKRSRGEKYRNVFYISLLGTGAMSGVIVMIYYLFPELAVGVLYGKEYLAAQTELVWMGMFISVYMLSNLIVNFLLSIGRVRTVILPAMAAVAQLGAIMAWHGSILQVIQVSLVITSCLTGALFGYLGYHGMKLGYEKR